MTTTATPPPTGAPVAQGAVAAAPDQPAATANPTPDLMMVTLLLKHHPGLTLDDVQQRLKASGWWDQFPPPGVRIVSWTVAMGLGQVCTLELPPALLPLVNLELERRGWGVFATECFPTYDFVPVRQRIQQRVLLGGQ